MGRNARLTGAGFGIGSVVYSSVEQLHAESDFRSDIYSLGCTLYFMLTGKEPFAMSGTIDELVAKKKSAPPEVPDVPAAVTALVRRMMKAKPEQRPKNCAELVAEIDAAMSGEPTGLGRWLTWRR